MIIVYISTLPAASPPDKFTRDGQDLLVKVQVPYSGACLGTRTKRACLVVDDGVVKSIEIEDNPGVVEVSGADTCLARL